MKPIIRFIILIMLVSCGSKKIATEQEQQAYLSLKSVVQSKKLKILSNFANPMVTNAFMQVANSNILGPGNTASSINISSNSNQFRIQEDSISGYFPYFGEVQFGGPYPGSNHQGIEFNDIPECYSITENDAKRYVQIQFRIADQYRYNEHYNVLITLYANTRSTIQVNSSNRSSIEYSGVMKPIAEDIQTP